MSVVVPTFNRLEQCLRAVRSALGQTRPPLEVLVGDDGSTDGTGTAIEELAREDERVRYVRLPANTGSPAGPRNACLALARGDWVAFLDDDDEWLPEKLAIQEPVLSEGFSIVCANARRDDGEAYFARSEGRVAFGREALLRDNHVIISTALVDRRLLLESGGFPEARRLAGIEDHAAWLAMADRGATGIRLPDVVAAYRTSGDDRLSSDAAARQRAGATLALHRWLAQPRDRSLAKAAGLHSARAAKLSAARIRERLSAAAESTRS